MILPERVFVTSTITALGHRPSQCETARQKKIKNNVRDLNHNGTRAQAVPVRNRAANLDVGPEPEVEAVG
jgi:hypothetical protein